MPLLVPAPRNFVFDEGEFVLPENSRVVINRSDIFQDARYLKPFLPGCSIVLWPGGSGAVNCIISEDLLITQAYTLTITPQGITVKGSDVTGVWYGVLTLAQLLRVYAPGGRGALPCLSIIDYPDTTRRGVMIDISRDRVPTMATLCHLVEQLASLKYNEIQLYMEHTFAYQGHEEVWEQASPITSEELLELHALCQRLHIDLVPNQNSLGHMERWLKHPRYNPLAETPEGFVSPWHRSKALHEPTTLNPQDPGSLALITDLYDQLLPHFTSAYFNIGGDEPWELGRGASREAWEKEPGRIYLEFLKKLHAQAALRRRTMQFWADIIVKYPALVEELPKNAVAMIWGYEASEPREGDVELIAGTGLPFYMVPGTSSWNSLIGRTTNALANLKNAARLGLKYEALGYLVTDWGDNGHWQPLCASYIGFTAGACYAWCYETNHDLDIAQAASATLFGAPGSAIGRIAYELGDLYTLLPVQLHNSTALFHALQMDEADMADMAATVAAPQALLEALQEIGKRLNALEAELAQSAEAPAYRRQLAHVIAMFRASARRMRSHLADGAALASAEVEALAAEQAAIWRLSFREGGLADSLRRFEPLMGAVVAQ
jgi:hypothetical protein